MTIYTIKEKLSFFSKMVKIKTIHLTNCCCSSLSWISGEMLPSSFSETHYEGETHILMIGFSTMTHAKSDSHCKSIQSKDANSPPPQTLHCSLSTSFKLCIYVKKSYLHTGSLEKYLRNLYKIDMEKLKQSDFVSQLANMYNIVNLENIVYFVVNL